MPSRALYKFFRRANSTEAWEISVETSLANATPKDELYQLNPVTLSKALLLPPGTIAIRPIERPSAIDKLRMDMESLFVKKLHEQDIKIKEQGIELAALGIRVKILENQPKILQIFESIKSSEKSIIRELLPAESFILSQNKINFSYLDTFRKGKPMISKSLENFFSNPAVMSIYEFINTDDFKLIKNYRNEIAHTGIDDISNLSSVAKNLAELIPAVPAREAEVIKAIGNSLPSIIQMVNLANSLDSDEME